MTLKKHQKNFLLLGLAILLFYLGFLFKIEALPIRHCDEGITVVQAQEMVISNNYIVGTRNFEIDHWGSKPQLMQWMDVIFIKMLGMRELSVRLPSILAALGIFIVFFFWLRYLKLGSVYFLLTCFIFVSIPATTFHIHSFRTGDPDTLMVFFLFLAAFQAYILLFPKKETDLVKHFMIFFLALFGAFMSKGSQVLLFLPGLAIAILCYRREKTFHFLAGGIAVLCLISIYYVLRNFHQPGFLIDVWTNELGGRFLGSIEGNQHPIYFYLKNFFVYRNPFWGIIVVTLIVWTIYKRKSDSTLTFLLLLSISYLLLISFAQTKLEWYDLAIYPLVCMMISYLVSEIYKSHHSKKVFSWCVALLLLIPSYLYGKHTLSIDEEVVEFHDYFYKICYFLRESLPKEINSNTKFIHNGRDGFFEQILFYTHANCSEGICIKWMDVDGLSIGDSVLIHQHEINHQVREKFQVSEILIDENVQLLKIESQRDTIELAK